MKPNTDRPDACAIGSEVHIFVAGMHQVMNIAAAEKLATHLSDAIAKAKASTAQKAKADEA